MSKESKSATRIYKVRDASDGVSVLVESSTAAGALRTALHARFTVTVPTTSEALALVKAGAEVLTGEEVRGEA